MTTQIANPTPQQLHLATSRLNLKTILVATDFSAESRAGLKTATAIAHDFGASLLILHCLPPLTYTTGLEAIPPDLIDISLSNAREQMRAQVAFCPSLAGIKHQEYIEIGPLVGLVNEFVADHKVGLIVVGSHGARGLEKLAMGSSAEAILQHAACPVIVVGPLCSTRAFKGESILFATTLAPGEYRPAQYAASLAEEMNARLTVLHVAPPTIAPPAIVQDVEAAARIALQTRIRELLPADIEDWCELKIVIVFGYPDDEILLAARCENADLILMGVHPHRILPDHAPWGTLSNTIRSSTCPILTVRPHYGE